MSVRRSRHPHPERVPTRNKSFLIYLYFLYSVLFSPVHFSCDGRCCFVMCRLWRHPPASIDRQETLDGTQRSPVRNGCLGNKSRSIKMTLDINILIHKSQLRPSFRPLNFQISNRKMPSTFNYSRWLWLCEINSNGSIWTCHFSLAVSRKLVDVSGPFRAVMAAS